MKDLVDGTLGFYNIRQSTKFPKSASPIKVFPVKAQILTKPIECRKSIGNRRIALI